MKISTFLFNNILLFYYKCSDLNILCCKTWNSDLSLLIEILKIQEVLKYQPLDIVR